LNEYDYYGEHACYSIHPSSLAPVRARFRTQGPSLLVRRDQMDARIGLGIDGLAVKFQEVVHSI
jgi:hypothetical protein